MVRVTQNQSSISLYMQYPAPAAALTPRITGAAGIDMAAVAIPFPIAPNDCNFAKVDPAFIAPMAD